MVSSTEGKSQTLFVHWNLGPATELLEPANWKTEALPASVMQQQWMLCLPMQVDGRRGIDLVTGSKGNEAAVGWWESPENPRDLGTWKYHRLTDAGWIMSLHAHDVDLDGIDDIVFTDRKGTSRGAKWLKRPAPQRVLDRHAWQTHRIPGTDKEQMFCTLHDLDQDGATDLLLTTWNGTVDLMRRLPDRDSVRFQPRELPNPHGYQRGKSITVADLNHDGKLDMVTTMRSVPLEGPAVFLWQHDGDPFHGKWTVTDVGGPDGSKFDLIEALDLDGDGDLDLLTCEEVANLGIVWFENPTFSADASRK